VHVIVPWKDSSWQCYTK